MINTMTLRSLAVCFLVFGQVSFFHPISWANESERPTPVRGVWVANVGSGSLSSPANIQKLVEAASRAHLNTLYVVVWNRGMTLYPSEIMEREFGVACDPRYSEFDMLAEVISAAHTKDIRVIAWFEFGFSSSYREPDGGHILRARPHWAAIDSAGNIATKNNFQWMNAFDLEVQNFILSLVKEVVEKYDVDGVQGDDRLPACPSIAGYDQRTVEKYRSEHEGRDPPANHLDAAWIDWRANLLNEFAGRMYRELKEMDSELIISAAPSVYPWSKENYLQDWPTWVAKGWVDEVCPQVYRDNIDSYRAELVKIVEQQVAPELLPLVVPGILVQTADGYDSAANLIGKMVEENRRMGFQGEVFFYDAALNTHREFFEEEYGEDRK